MRNTNSKKRAKQYIPNSKKHLRKAFELAESMFDQKTLRQFYDTKEKRFEDLKSVNEGCDKSYAFQIKANARLLDSLGSPHSKKKTPSKSQMKSSFRILSSMGIGSKNMRASDLEARIVFSKLLMKQFCRIYDEENAEGTTFYKVDFILPWLHTDEFEPHVDIYKLKDLVRRRCSGIRG